MIRLSSAGDVTMTVPVLHSFQNAFPSIKLTILTKKQYGDLFYGLNADIIFAETKGEHKGFAGLYRLFKQIKKKGKIDGVADLHNVIRSRIIGMMFRLSGIRVATIDKQRKEKKELTRKEEKLLRPLESNFIRYSKVFNQLGFQFNLRFQGLFNKEPLDAIITNFTGSKTGKWVGVAPFAAFKWKEYPFDLLKKALVELYNRKDVKLIFFGGGESDGEMLDELVKQFPGSVNMANKVSLIYELKLMSQLDVMLAMDSANMHFASIVNIPVVSIWGATHPYLGFAPWQQPEANQVQIALFCRPCSVYGNVECYRGDHACMFGISESMIIKHLEPHLSVPRLPS